jgi:NAD(P)-dependent dehydrogenase (short-subunit alcohol dehydrogenase family)
LGFNEVTPYVVSKTAIRGLTYGLAVEWADESILVNSVSPGWIKTEMLEKIADTEREGKILNRMPLHRYGETSDIANMVWYLVSPAGKYITGQDFVVDGGALAFGY